LFSPSDRPNFQTAKPGLIFDHQQKTPSWLLRFQKFTSRCEKRSPGRQGFPTPRGATEPHKTTGLLARRGWIFSPWDYFPVNSPWDVA